MRLTLVFILLSCLLSDIQAQRNNSITDSFNYYQKQATQIRKSYMDSLNKDVTYLETQNNILRLKTQSDGYSAFTIYANISSADFSQFNSANAQSNFTQLKENMTSIGYGFSFKKNRRVFDANLTAFGIAKKAKKGSESIKTSFSTFLQLEWGYDFVRNKVVNIYPFLGIGLRSSSIQYEGPSSTNPNFTNVSNVIQNNSDVNAYATEIGYQAGLGIEYALSGKSYAGGVIIFAKGGVNNAFKKKAYKIEGLTYDPGFDYGKMNISFGIKLFGRS